MHKNNILYVEIEVMARDNKRTTRGILGGFTQRTTDSTTMGYLRIYPDNVSNLYCVSCMYSIVAIIVEHEGDHLECNYYELDKENQSAALDKIETIMKILTEQGISNGRKGISLTDYPKVPKKYLEETKTKGNTKSVNKNSKTTSTTTTYNRSSTYEQGWYNTKKATIIRMTRKSKKPSKKKLEHMRKATRSITKGTYKAPIVVINTKESLNDESHRADDYVDYDENMANAWQGMHQPGFDYMD